MHNFRSIKDAKINLKDYSLLIGENNAGKTNFITALRMFYEDQGIKFDEDRDFPKFTTDDKESWIELKFKTTANEQENLKECYKSKENVLKVRRYFKSDKYVKSGQSNIYGYENDVLSNNLFYGAKNISKEKLGNVVYIPAVSTNNEIFKLSGPSPFRELVNFVFDKVISDSPTFKSLNEIIGKFNSDFMAEYSDGISLNSLRDEINKSLNSWGIDFGMRVNSLESQEIVKTLFSYYLVDKNLNQDVDINLLGQGLQRHLIYTLIKLSSGYVKKAKHREANFSTDFTLLLFEEPEAFLHPSQQTQMNINLRNVAKEDSQQVLISTHSPNFVSKNIHSLSSLLSVKKENAVTNIFQLKSEDVDKLFSNNYSLFKTFSDILNNQHESDSLKEKIKKRGLGNMEPNVKIKLEEESVKYFMWLDAERAASFFSKHVIICEGATEKIAFEYLINNSLTTYIDRNIYILDAMGKFNIHRYMNLFGNLGITHSVLFDRDSDTDIQQIVNKFLESNKNEYTKVIKTFHKDLEDFLEIKEAPRKDLKPLNVLTKLKNGEIKEEKIDKLKNLFKCLCELGSCA